MSKAISSFLGAFTLLLCLTAHGLVFSEEIMLRPTKYESPHKNVDIRPDGPGVPEGWGPWYVVVINENARTFTTPGGSSQHSRLSFGEYYYAVAEEGRFLNIYSDPRPSDTQLSQDAKDMGWISKHDVLMWDVALESPETGIALKGMILNTLRALQDFSQIDFTTIQAFKNPDLTEATDYQARLFEIFYIYQYSSERDAVLLGRRPHFNVGQLRREGEHGGLIGWVDRSRVLEWDHRVAIEPNYEEAAVAERRRQNIRTSIVSASANHDNKWQCAEKLRMGRGLGDDCEVVWDDDIYEEDGSFERRSGYWRRFPVVGDFDDDIYEVMVMGEMRGRFGSIDDRVGVDVRTQLNRLIEKYRNVNIVFVVDGTNSMQPYFEPVVNSINNILNIFQRQADETKQLRFGYIVYRDYLERDRLLEHMPLTTDARRIMSELRAVEARDRFDIYPHESMNYGLSKAFEKVFTDPDETNIIIHVADAGSHSRDDPSYVPQEVVVNLMAEYGCFYIAYQSHHIQNHQAYRDFPIQVRQIMRNASEAMYEEWLKVGGDELFDEKPALVTDGNVSRIINGTPMVLIETPFGSSFDLGLLTDEITQAITEIDEYNDYVIERLRDILERGKGFQVAIGESESRYTSSFAPGVLEALRRMDVDYDALRHFYDENVELVFEGYTSRTHSMLNSSLYKPVILLDAREFASIYTTVNRLERATQGSGEVRARLYDTWMEILRRHIGTSGAAIDEEITLEEAATMVFGIPMRAGMLRQVQLKDIRDPAVFSDADLRRYVNRIQLRANVLESIANARDYPYSFVSNDIKYFWLSVDKLP